MKLKQKTRIKGYRNLIVGFFWDAFDLGVKMQKEAPNMKVAHVILDKEFENKRKELIEKFIETMSAGVPEIRPTPRTPDSGTAAPNRGVSE